MSRDEAYDLVSKLEPVKFSYKSDPEKNKKIGFISEKVPDIVSSEDHKQVKFMQILSAVTKVVKEQQTTIDLLSHELSELKNKVHTKDT
ncbi:MAG: tail fiber domain-containing protein [Nitrososphaeraceae archaeon]